MSESLFNDILEEFRKYKVVNQDKRESSVNRYILNIRKFFAWIKKENPEEITMEDVQDYIIYLKVDQKNSTNTQKIKQASIRIFFDWYSKRHHIKNPCELIGPIQEEIKIPSMFTPDDLTRMVYSCNTSKPIGRRDAAILCLLADTGIRISELMALNLGSIQIHENNFTLVVPRVKSRERLVPFGQLTAGAMVAEFFAAYYQDIKYVQNFKDSDPLFVQYGPKHHGARLGLKGIKGVITRVRKNSEITKRITAHSFRHFFGTYSVINGTRVEQLRLLMGHAWLETTMRYVHIADVISPETIKHRGTTSLQAPKHQTGFVQILKKAREKLNHDMKEGKL
jgi:site-specific recombinase XerD